NVETLRQGWNKLGELPVGGRVYTQPLFVGGVRVVPERPPLNLVLIATERNNVDAFDADSLSPTPLWHRFLGQNDQTRMGHPGCEGIPPDGIAIEPTPVIDRAAQHIFISYRVNPGPNLDTARQEVIALDIRNGQTVAGPVEVTGPEF